MSMANTLKTELLMLGKEALYTNTKHLRAHAGALQMPADVKSYPDLESFLKSKLLPQIEDILRNTLPEAFTER